MNKLKLDELRNIFSSIDEASSRNASDFPYSETQASFNQKLKEFLEGHFGSDIKFDRDETFAYIQAHYKEIGIEINVYGGIILSVEDKEATNIVKDFEPIFSGIVGSAPICRYNYCSRVGKTSYPTVEWNHHPEDRLYELVHGYSCSPGEYMTNFHDYYTASIIENLGDNLLTIDGYTKLFEGRSHDLDFRYYKIRQIQKVYPNIDSSTIYAWIESSKSSLSKKIS